MQMKKRILSIVLIITLIIPMFYYISNAQEETVTVDVEQVTSAADINSQNLYEYVLVYERENDTDIALAAIKGGSASTNALSRSNYREVSVENGKLRTTSTDFLFWNFTR